MLSNTYDIQNYLLELEENTYKLKTTHDSLIFDMSTSEILKIILIIRKYHCNKKKLFEKYVKKEIFSKILSFLPQKYVMSKRSICKNWNELLTNDFMRNSLGPFLEPYKICYVGNFDIKFKDIFKANNKLCSYDSSDGDIRILNNKGELIEKYQLGKYIYKITENMDFVWKIKNLIIENAREKIFINWQNDLINDIKIDKEQVYILGRWHVFQYNKKGTYIRRFAVDSCYIFGNKYGKIVLDNDEIYSVNEYNNDLKVYSKTGKIRKKMGWFNKGSKFDMSKNYIFIIDELSNLIRIYTKNGKEICNKEHNIKGCQDLIVINDNLYIITNNKIHVYELNFF